MFISISKSLISINGKSFLGKQPKENFDFPDLRLIIFPSLDITSISLVSGNFRIIS